MPGILSSFLKLAVSIVVIAILLRWVGVAAIAARDIQNKFLYRRAVMSRVSERISWERYGGDAGVTSSGLTILSNKIVPMSDIIDFIIRNSLDMDVVIDTSRADLHVVSGTGALLWYNTEAAGGMGGGAPTLKATGSLASSSGVFQNVVRLETHPGIFKNVVVIGPKAPLTNPMHEYMADPIFLFDKVFNYMYDLKFSATLLSDGDLVPTPAEGEYARASITGVYFSLQ